MKIIQKLQNYWDEDTPWWEAREKYVKTGNIPLPLLKTIDANKKNQDKKNSTTLLGALHGCNPQKRGNCQKK